MEPGKKLATTCKACLAVLWAVLLLYPSLEGNCLIVRINHEALKWLLTMTVATGKLAIGNYVFWNSTSMSYSTQV